MVSPMKDMEKFLLAPESSGYSPAIFTAGISVYRAEIMDYHETQKRGKVCSGAG